MGFASIMTIGDEAMLKVKKYHHKGKDKKRIRVAEASVGLSAQPYMPVKLPSSREAHLKVMAVDLEASNAVLPSPLCADPMLSLVAILAILKATLDSPFVVLKDKGQVAETGGYLTKMLATVAMLVDKSMPALAALYDAISCGKGDG